MAEVVTGRSWGQEHRLLDDSVFRRLSA